MMSAKKLAKETRGQGKARRVGNIVFGEDGLTDKERKFVYHFVETGGKNATESAKQAGYSEKTAYQSASQMLRKPRILDEIAKVRRDGYQASAVKAKAFLESQMNDERLPANIRLAAAKDLADRGGDKPKDKLEIEDKPSVADQICKLAELKAKYIHNKPTSNMQATDSQAIPHDSQSDGDEGNLTKH